MSSTIDRRLHDSTAQRTTRSPRGGMRRGPKQPRVFRLTVAAVAVSIAVALALPNAFAAGRVDASALETDGRYDRFIVQFREGSAERADPALVQRALQSAAGRTVPLAASDKGAPQVGYLRRLAVGADVVRTDRKLDRAGAEALMREIATDPSVEYVEIDAVMTPAFTPNDPGWPYQWHYRAGKGGVNLPWAWNRASGYGVVVAVLDTGITNHSDLTAHKLPGYDFLSEPERARDGDGRDPDPADEGDWAAENECGEGRPARNSGWHGTHVTGTIAALTDNNNYVAGVAYRSRFVPVRVLGKCGGNYSDLADAIVWASGGGVPGVPANANPAEVINMSLGGGGACGTTLQNAINSAAGRGSVVVAAAGNSNADVSGFQPANCNNVISVAANNRNGGRAGYSNYGNLIDISAPGGSANGNYLDNILSTLNNGTTVPVAQSYNWYVGTSMAAPHVAGVVALMQSISPKSPSQVEAILEGSARPFPNGYCSGGCGTGIVDAEAAVNAAIGRYYKNDTDVAIPNNATVTSSIRIGRNSRAPSTLRVGVYLTHHDVGQLKVDLISPDGTVFTLHDRTSGSNPYINQTYTVNAYSERAYGAWKLRVNDNGSSDTGTLRKWSLIF